MPYQRVFTKRDREIIASIPLDDSPVKMKVKKSEEDVSEYDYSFDEDEDPVEGGFWKSKCRNPFEEWSDDNLDGLLSWMVGHLKFWKTRFTNEGAPVDEEEGADDDKQKQEDNFFRWMIGRNKAPSLQSLFIQSKMEEVLEHPLTRYKLPAKFGDKAELEPLPSEWFPPISRPMYMEYKDKDGNFITVRRVVGYREIYKKRQRLWVYREQAKIRFQMAFLEMKRQLFRENAAFYKRQKQAEDSCCETCDSSCPCHGHSSSDSSTGCQCSLCASSESDANTDTCSLFRDEVPVGGGKPNKGGKDSDKDSKKSKPDKNKKDKKPDDKTPKKKKGDLSVPSHVTDKVEKKDNKGKGPPGIMTKTGFYPQFPKSLTQASSRHRSHHKKKVKDKEEAAIAQERKESEALNETERAQILLRNEILEKDEEWFKLSDSDEEQIQLKDKTDTLGKQKPRWMATDISYESQMMQRETRFFRFFLSFFGRQPFRSVPPVKTAVHRHITFAMRPGLYQVPFILSSLFVWFVTANLMISMFLSYSASTVAGGATPYDKFESAELFKYLNGFAVVVAQGLVVAIWSATVIFRDGEFICQYLTCQSQALSDMETSGMKGVKMFIIWNHLIVLVYGAVLSVCYFVRDAPEFVRGTSGVIGMMTLRSYYPKIGFNVQLFDYARKFGFFYQIYTFYCFRSIMATLQINAKILTHAAQMWNFKFGLHFSQFAMLGRGHLYRLKLSASLVKIFKHHRYLYCLSKLYGACFNIAILFYFLMQASVALLVFVSLFFYQDVPGDKDKNYIGDNEQEIPTKIKELGTYVNFVLAAGVVLIQSLGDFIFTTRSIAMAGATIIDGFEFVRRNGQVVCASSHERRLIQSLQWSFSGTSPVAIRTIFDISSPTIFGSLGAILLLYSLIIQIQSGSSGSIFRTFPCAHDPTKQCALLVKIRGTPPTTLATTTTTTTTTMIPPTTDDPDALDWWWFFDDCDKREVESTTKRNGSILGMCSTSFPMDDTRLTKFPQRRLDKTNKTIIEAQWRQGCVKDHSLETSISRNCTKEDWQSHLKDFFLPCYIFPIKTLSYHERDCAQNPYPLAPFILDGSTNQIAHQDNPTIMDSNRPNFTACDRITLLNSSIRDDCGWIPLPGLEFELPTLVDIAFEFQESLDHIMKGGKIIRRCYTDDLFRCLHPEANRYCISAKEGIESTLPGPTEAYMYGPNCFNTSLVFEFGLENRDPPNDTGKNNYNQHCRVGISTGDFHNLKPEKPYHNKSEYDKSLENWDKPDYGYCRNDTCVGDNVRSYENFGWPCENAVNNYGAEFDGFIEAMDFRKPCFNNGTTYLLMRLFYLKQPKMMKTTTEKPTKKTTTTNTTTTDMPSNGSTSDTTTTSTTTPSSTSDMTTTTNSTTEMSTEMSSTEMSTEMPSSKMPATKIPALDDTLVLDLSLNATYETCWSVGYRNIPTDLLKNDNVRDCWGRVIQLDECGSISQSTYAGQEFQTDSSEPWWNRKLIVNGPSDGIAKRLKMPSCVNMLIERVCWNNRFANDRCMDPEIVCDQDVPECTLLRSYFFGEDCASAATIGRLHYVGRFRFCKVLKNATLPYPTKFLDDAEYKDIEANWKKPKYIDPMSCATSTLPDWKKFLRDYYFPCFSKLLNRTVVLQQVKSSMTSPFPEQGISIFSEDCGIYPYPPNTIYYTCNNVPVTMERDDCGWPTKLPEFNNAIPPAYGPPMLQAVTVSKIDCSSAMSNNFVCDSVAPNITLQCAQKTRCEDPFIQKFCKWWSVTDVHLNMTPITLYLFGNDCYNKSFISVFVEPDKTGFCTHEAFPAVLKSDPDHYFPDKNISQICLYGEDCTRTDLIRAASTALDEYNICSPQIPIPTVLLHANLYIPKSDCDLTIKNWMSRTINTPNRPWPCDVTKIAGGKYEDWEEFMWSRQPCLGGFATPNKTFMVLTPFDKSGASLYMQVIAGTDCWANPYGPLFDGHDNNDTGFTNCWGAPLDLDDCYTDKQADDAPMYFKKQDARAPNLVAVSIMINGSKVTRRCWDHTRALARCNDSNVDCKQTYYWFGDDCTRLETFKSPAGQTNFSTLVHRLGDQYGFCTVKRRPTEMLPTRLRERILTEDQYSMIIIAWGKVNYTKPSFLCEIRPNDTMAWYYMLRDYYFPCISPLLKITVVRQQLMLYGGTLGEVIPGPDCGIFPYAPLGTASLPPIISGPADLDYFNCRNFQIPSGSKALDDCGWNTLVPDLGNRVPKTISSRIDCPSGSIYSCMSSTLSYKCETTERCTNPDLIKFCKWTNITFYPEVTRNTSTRMVYLFGSDCYNRDFISSFVPPGPDGFCQHEIFTVIYNSYNKRTPNTIYLKDKQTAQFCMYGQPRCTNSGLTFLKGAVKLDEYQICNITLPLEWPKNNDYIDIAECTMVRAAWDKNMPYIATIPPKIPTVPYRCIATNTKTDWDEYKWSRQPCRYPNNTVRAMILTPFNAKGVPHVITSTSAGVPPDARPAIDCWKIPYGLYNVTGIPFLNCFGQPLKLDQCGNDMQSDVGGYYKRQDPKTSTLVPTRRAKGAVPPSVMCFNHPKALAHCMDKQSNCIY